jgi:putative acetyltransferase
VTAAVRATTPADRESVIALVRAAFSTGGRDGHEEVDIVRETWDRGAAPVGFDLVAVDDDSGEVVGHVLAARGDLAGQPVLGVAPLAVAPGHQRAGTGSALMRELIARAEAANEPMLVLLGSPDYYSRFGFEASGPLGIHYRPVGTDNPHFQVRRLAAFDPSLRGDFVYCWELPVTLP